MLTLVGKYLGNHVTGYNIYLSSSAADYAFGSTNPSTIEPIATVDLGDFLGDRSTERIWSEYTIPAETPGYYLWVRPFNGDGIEGYRQQPDPADGLTVSAGLWRFLAWVLLWPWPACH